MFRVTLEYTVSHINGYGSLLQRDTWLEKHSVRENAIDMAKADSEILSTSRYGMGIRIHYHSTEVTELAPCPTCSGRGVLPSMEGYYTCTHCNGKKHFEVTHESAG